MRRRRNNIFSFFQAENDIEATFSRYQHETSTFGVRFAEVRKQEDELAYQKEEFIQQKRILEKEFEQVRQASQEIQRRSEDVERFAKVPQNCVIDYAIKNIISCDN